MAKGAGPGPRGRSPARRPTPGPPARPTLSLKGGLDELAGSEARTYHRGLPARCWSLQNAHHALEAEKPWAPASKMAWSANLLWSTAPARSRRRAPDRPQGEGAPPPGHHHWGSRTRCARRAPGADAKEGSATGGLAGTTRLAPSQASPGHRARGGALIETARASKQAAGAHRRDRHLLHVPRSARPCAKPP